MVQTRVGGVPSLLSSSLQVELAEWTRVVVSRTVARVEQECTGLARSSGLLSRLPLEWMTSLVVGLIHSRQCGEVAN